MRILIITQNDPFFLKDNLNYLLDSLGTDNKIIGCVISYVSPFGKKESFLKKAFKTLKIFGLNFFLFYSLKYLKNFFFNTSLKKMLKNKGLKCINLKSSINSNESLNFFKELQPDLIISILGNQIFKKKLINLPKYGCINLHTALLPKYRGLMPTFWVLKNNEQYTGVSVFFIDEGIDSGPIIVQKKIKINQKTHFQLISKPKKLGMDSILEAVNIIKNGNIKIIENDNYKNLTILS